MWKRAYWQAAAEERWRERTVLWLMGVRRVGKTSLAQQLANVEYFDCELPSVRRQMEDPESFLGSLEGKRVVLDEVHRLQHPAELLKIAADHHPKVRVLATGSSTLGASARFRDTLAGRKRELWLTPMTLEDLSDFERPDLPHRLLQGGLPPFFLSERPIDRDFQEWLDAYWAKDILELFRLERRHSFARFFELLMAQSGGIFEATRFAAPCEVSRTTIANYLAVLEETFVVHVLRPFAKNPEQEIVAAPRVFGFDTGFVCYHRGWSSLRPDDLGSLWEHFTLNQLHAHLQTREIRYWRTKQKQEVDFVVPRRGKAPVAIECKWSADHFDERNLLAFRARYPGDLTFVVLPTANRAFSRRYKEVQVRFVGLRSLLDALDEAGVS
jgi:uncharacterized protein